MALDVDKLFRTLEEGFDGLEKGMTDKTLRMEMRMEKMRQRMEGKADQIRRKAESMGQIKRRPVGRSSFRTTFRVIRRVTYFIIFMFMVAYMAVTFSQFLKEQQYTPKTLNPEVEKTQELKKL